MSIYINNNVKETDDSKKVGVADPGSIPGTSTNSLQGRNVHGVTAGYGRQPEYYYTENQWSRLGMQGPLPPERNLELQKQLLTNEGGETDFDGANEILFEDSDT